MKIWRWSKGRQGSGYDVLPLVLSQRLRLDVYLIRLAEGVDVPPHTDPAAEGMEHHRVNWIFWKSGGGDHGIQPYEGWPVIEVTDRRLYHFRPDIQRHLVQPVTTGSQWILSVGWLRKKNNQ